MKMSTNTEYNKLLIVEDSTETRALLVHLFKKIYEVKDAANAIEAINIIKEGFTPNVILSDLRLPYISGAEFLKKTISLVPDAVRVLITSPLDTQEIINAINQAKVYLFLTKPFDNVQLIQSIKNCFEYYEMNSEKNKLIELLSQRNELFLNTLKSTRQIAENVIPEIIRLSTTFEKGYFSNHTKAIIEISRAILDSIEMNPINHYNIVISALIFHKVMSKMPDKFTGTDPNLLESNAKKEFIRNFNRQLDILYEIEALRPYSQIVTQIWEHYDGTGLPLGISKDKLMIESQIISLAHMYHNLVYTIPLEQLLEMDDYAEFEQTPEITMKRHSEAIQTIFRCSNWFHLELIEKFKELIKYKKCSALLPDTALLKAIYIGDHIIPIRIEQKFISKYKNEKFFVPVERFLNKKIEKARKLDALETRLPLNEIRAGMIANSDITTKYGRIVILKGTLINQDHIEELKQLSIDGLISGDFDLIVPREMPV